MEEWKREFPTFAPNAKGFQSYYSRDELYSFEQNFQERPWHDWFLRNWKWTIVISAIYVVLVFSGKRYLRERTRFELRIPLALWSGSLALFSIFGTYRALPEFTYYLYNHGFQEMVCNPCYSYLYEGAFPFWQTIFLLSKIVELGDTAFIVLRKQPLIFLHWYHHITVLIYSIWSYTEWTAPGRWFFVINLFVHSVMYSYYALRALRIRVPKWVSLVITTLQIVQMMTGLSLGGIVYWHKINGRACQQTYNNIFWCSAMYGSYFVLFSHFFYNAYIKPTPKAESRKDMNGNTHTSNGVSHKAKQN